MLKSVFVLILIIAFIPAVGCSSSRIIHEISSDIDSDGTVDTVRQYDTQGRLVAEIRLNVPASGIRKVFMGSATEWNVVGGVCFESQADMAKTYAGRSIVRKGVTKYYYCDQRLMMTRYALENGGTESATIYGKTENRLAHFEDYNHDQRFDQMEIYREGSRPTIRKIDIPDNSGYEELLKSAGLANS